MKYMKKQPKWKSRKKCLDCSKTLGDYYSRRCRVCWGLTRRGIIPKNVFKKGHINYLISHTKQTKDKISKNNARHWLNKGMSGMTGKIQSDFQRKQVTGINSKRWKGGITDLRHQIRTSWKYKTYIISGFKRDNYTCQICDDRGSVMHFDHYPKTFAQVLKENNILCLEDALGCRELWSIDNGRTLCAGCHYFVTFDKVMSNNSKWGKVRYAKS